MGFLAVEITLVAVGFKLNIFIFQRVITDKNCNCYGTKMRAGSPCLSGAFHFMLRFYSPVNYQENILLVVNYKAIDLGVEA